MTKKRLQFYIDGQWVDPVTPKSLPVINPSNEEVIGEISLGSKADVDKAVAAARRAFETFSVTSKEERVALLDKIGMQWEKPDPWQHRYELAQDYLQEHGNLLIPAKYKTDDGIWLGRWLYEQKVLLRKQSPKLNADKIDKLRKLLGEEPTEKVG